MGHGGCNHVSRPLHQINGSHGVGIGHVWPYPLDSLKGKVVVLEFWTTWCGPCVAAIPHLNELSEKYADKPVQFIAISFSLVDAVRTAASKDEALDQAQYWNNPSFASAAYAYLSR